MVAVGTVYGWTTTILDRLAEDNEDMPVRVTSEQQSWIVSLTVIASMFGSFLGAFLADIFGRKICLLCTSLFYIIGWIIVIFASNVIALYLSRIIVGVGVGMSYTTNPMYVSEVADTNIRGALGTLIAVNVFTGSLIACSVGPYVSYTTLGIVLLVIPVVFVMTFIWFPESPYFLAMKGRHEAAAKSIAFFKDISMDEARQELDLVMNNINDSKSDCESWKVKIHRLLSSNNRKAFLIVFMLIVTQQFSGNFTTMQYLTHLFSHAKIGIDSNIATIIVFAFGLISGTFATMTVETAGRRWLLMISTFGSGLTLLTLAIYLYLEYININVAAVNLLPVIVIVLFQITYQVGLGTLPNALIGELFPTNAKGVAAAAITISDGILGFAVSKFYLTIGEALGDYFLYFLFAGTCFIAFIFACVCIPETKNKSFLEIQQELAKKGFRYYQNSRRDRQDVIA